MAAVEPGGFVLGLFLTRRGQTAFLQMEPRYGATTGSRAGRLKAFLSARLVKALAENTACSGRQNLRTLAVRREGMVLTPQGGVSATAGQQADYPGGKDAT